MILSYFRIASPSLKSFSAILCAFGMSSRRTMDWPSTTTASPLFRSAVARATVSCGYNFIAFIFSPFPQNDMKSVLNILSKKHAGDKIRERKNRFCAESGRKQGFDRAERFRKIFIRGLSFWSRAVSWCKDASEGTAQTDRVKDVMFGQAANG